MIDRNAQKLRFLRYQVTKAGWGMVMFCAIITLQRMFPELYQDLHFAVFGLLFCISYCLVMTYFEHKLVTEIWGHWGR